ncbi:hypothetical protein HDU67_000097 [Dinochytrium kinnereticum]|nr:hypothetical protein HDU67_000097 [Dinochytrium kinnereticum]
MGRHSDDDRKSRRDESMRNRNSSFGNPLVADSKALTCLYNPASTKNEEENKTKESGIGPGAAHQAKAAEAARHGPTPPAPRHQALHRYQGHLPQKKSDVKNRSHSDDAHGKRSDHGRDSKRRRRRSRSRSGSPHEKRGSAVGVGKKSGEDERKIEAVPVAPPVVLEKEAPKVRDDEKEKKSKKKKRKEEKKSKKKKKKKASSSSSEGDGPRSSITGKKIKLKVSKSKRDKQNDINRQELRQMLNQMY